LYCAKQNAAELVRKAEEEYELKKQKAMVMKEFTQGINEAWNHCFTPQRKIIIRPPTPVEPATTRAIGAPKRLPTMIRAPLVSALKNIAAKPLVVRPKK